MIDIRIHRRALFAGATAALSMSAGSHAPAPAAAGGTRLQAIGLQLYTLRDIFQPDPLGTLERVAAIGYREVEFGDGGYDTMDHAALRRQMDRLGLQAPSLHVPLEWLTTRLDFILGAAETLGAGIIVLPWIAPDLRTADKWPSVITTINRLAEQVNKAGLRFAYHNHDFEFLQTVGNTSLFDLLLAGTDKDLVALELDLFWAVDAGQDPAALMQRLPGRVLALHAKDRARDGSMVAVGAGAIDFASVFRRSAAAGVRHVFVEHDRPRPPFLPSVAFSFQTLNQMTY